MTTITEDSAYNLADILIDREVIPPGLTDCDKYGMTFGCDGCPHLNKNTCKNYEGD